MYSRRAGAPASRDTNMLKVENPYFDKDAKLPTNTTNLMPQQLQAIHLVPHSVGSTTSVVRPARDLLRRRGRVIGLSKSPDICCCSHSRREPQPCAASKGGQPVR